MLGSILNLTSDEKKQIEKGVGPLRSVTEFCSNLLEATKELPLKDKVTGILPWAVEGGKVIAEITPLTKVLVKIADDLTKEKDPEVLGTIACTLAYQRSAALALAQTGEPQSHVPFETSLESARQQVKKLEFNGSLAGFSLEAPLAHPFIWHADDALSLVVRNAGYSEREWHQIQLRVHDQFRADLVEVLSHGETASKFEPFTKRLSLGDESAAYAAINAHIDRQRWAFEDRPVLNTEPFTLAEVYVDTDCGKLKWKDFPTSGDPKRDATGEKFDPFSEQFGGRQPLLETVLEYLRDPKFNDAIVIQGAPGSGKSCFTLRLANVLRREGLRPLRIRLRFLDLKKDLPEALARVVVQPEEGEDPALARTPQCSDPFLKEAIFQERTKFGDAEICPYVLILDGWDEISVAVNEGFEVEVRRMLDNVRRQFLYPRPVKVRVLLTGRPSHAVERSQFLRDETPVLTVREYTADQLELYADKVKLALENGASASDAERWRNVKWSGLEKVFASYRKDPSKLEILGLPLLAHLSLRLLVQWQGEFEDLLSNRTTLYRHLLDLTCSKAGKAFSEDDDLQGQTRLRGPELRRMLQQTAVAITTYGNESIPFHELQLRLKMKRPQMMEAATNTGRDHPLTSLMISFYFKGGREHLGCEFLHKSFREYLFAESIVETLKEYGRKQVSTLAERQPYWKDFEQSDPRWQFSRDLSRLLCPYPLSGEIRVHLAELVSWEIGRSGGNETEKRTGEPLDGATTEQWEVIRDALASLWDWWGEGVHLRPQPYRDDSENLHYHHAYVNDLMDHSLPLDRGRDAPIWWPGRSVNVDSNIGDGLCRLNACVHTNLLQKGGWFNAPVTTRGIEEVGDTLQRPCQTRYRVSEGTMVLFRPSGRGRGYFLITVLALTRVVCILTDRSQGVLTSAAPISVRRSLPRRTSKGRAFTGRGSAGRSFARRASAAQTSAEQTSVGRSCSMRTCVARTSTKRTSAVGQSCSGRTSAVQTSARRT